MSHLSKKLHRQNNLPEIISMLFNDIGKSLTKKSSKQSGNDVWSSISVFFESLAVSEGLKNLISKLLEHDEILTANSFTKIIKYVCEKAVIVDDLDKAFRRLFLTSYIVTVVESLEENQIVVELETTIKELSAIVETYTAEEFNVYKFQGNNINSNVEAQFRGYLCCRGLSHESIEKVIGVIRRNFEINFLELLDDSNVTFRKYSTYIKSNAYIKENRNSYLKEYYGRLKALFLEPIFQDETRLNLRDIYIEPRFKIHKSCFKANDDRIKVDYHREDKGFFNVCESATINEFTYEVFKGTNKCDLKFGNTRIMFILGYPGQGKSSFCKKFMYDIITDKTPISRSLYHVRLRNLKTKELRSAPIKTLERYIQKDTRISDIDLEREPALLILDGLDEAGMQEAQTRDIDGFCKELIREIRTTPHINLQIIITSRYGYIDIDALELIQDNTVNSLVVQIQEFDVDRQKKWLSIYKKHHPEVTLTEKVIDSVNDKENAVYSSVRELIGQPILLHLIAVSNYDLSKGCINKAQIYKGLFDRLLKRNWDSSGQLEIFKEIEHNDDLRAFIRSLALAIYHTGNDYIHKSKLLSNQATIEFNKQLGESDKQFTESLKGVMVAFYLQEVRKKDSDRDNTDDKNDYAIEFLHKSLLEYMVAEKVWETIKEFGEKVSGRRKFVISETDVALKIVFKLFSPRFLSIEVVEYLVEIIANEESAVENEERAILKSRLVEFLPDLIQRDFFDIKAVDNSLSFPLDKAINTFFGYWTVLSNIKIDKGEADYSLILSSDNILENMSDRFSYLVQCLPQNKVNRLNLHALRLNRIDLSSMNLMESNFSYSIIKDLRLLECGFFQCDFSNTTLTNAVFTSSFLFLCNLDNVTMVECYLAKCAIINASFEKANLKESNFDEANLERTSFIKAILVDTSFIGANLKDAILQGGQFENVNFREADLECANVEGAKFIECDFTGANLKGLVGVDKAEFHDVKFDDDELVSK